MAIVYQNNFDADTTGALPAGWSNKDGTYVVGTTNPISGTKTLGANPYLNGKTALYEGIAARENSIFGFTQKLGVATLTQCYFPAFRMNAGYTNGFLFAYEAISGGHQFNFYKRTNGSFASILTAEAPSFSADAVVKTEVKSIGSTHEIRMWLASNEKPTAPSFTVTNAAYPTGFMGLYLGLANPGLAATGIDDFFIDDAADEEEEEVPPPDTTPGALHPLTLSNPVFSTGYFGQGLSGGNNTGPGIFPVPADVGWYMEFLFKTPVLNGSGNKVLFELPGAFKIWLDGTTGNPQISVNNSSNNSGVSSSTGRPLNAGTWHHGYLICRSQSSMPSGQSNIELCIDSSIVWGFRNPCTSSQWNSQTNPLRIGANSSGGEAFTGVIDSISVGYGNKFVSQVVFPTNPTNGLDPALYSLYNLDGDGLDSRGTAGTLPNGSVTTNTYSGQERMLSGALFNGATAGTLRLDPAGNSAYPQEFPVVVSGANWSVTFLAAPGDYAGMNLTFRSSSVTGGPLNLPAFSIIPIENGGDMNGATGSGETIPPDPEPLPPPTISITTVNSAILTGKEATIEGVANFQGDTNGSIQIFRDPMPSGSPVSLGAVAVTAGAWSKQVTVQPGLFKFRFVATANAQTATASTGDLRVLNLVGNFTLPTV